MFGKPWCAGAASDGRCRKELNLAFWACTDGLQISALSSDQSRLVVLTRVLPLTLTDPWPVVLAGFTAYLLSEECELFDPEHRVVCQDMTQPLTHYFVASSHNT